jgi:hypothetical protein
MSFPNTSHYLFRNTSIGRAMALTNGGRLKKASASSVQAAEHSKPPLAKGLRNELLCLGETLAANRSMILTACEAAVLERGCPSVDTDIAAFSLLKTQLFPLHSPGPLLPWPQDLPNHPEKSLCQVEICVSLCKEAILQKPFAWPYDALKMRLLASVGNLNVSQKLELMAFPGNFKIMTLGQWS